LQKLFKTKFISLCGEIRRQCTTVSGIEMIAAITSSKCKNPSLRRYLTIKSSGKEHTLAHILDEIPVTIYHTTADHFYTDLFKRTGNDSHVSKVLEKITTKTSFTSDEAIYKKAKLPFIVPEMREDASEWDFEFLSDL
jgi:DNA polymerase (family 10)